MEPAEIIEAVNGKDEQGKSRTAFTLLSELYDINSGNFETAGSLSLHKPVFKIERHGKYVQTDMIFRSHLDTDLSHVMLILNQFGSNMHRFDESEDIKPILSLTMVPVAFEGRIYIQALNPIMWVRTSDTVSGGELNTIRLLFESTDFNLFEDCDIDNESIANELLREEEYSDQLEAIAEKEKEAERTRNRELEDLRRAEYLSGTLYEERELIHSFKELS